MIIYNSPYKYRASNRSLLNPNILTVPLQMSNTFTTNTIANRFNTEFRPRIIELHCEQMKLNMEVNQKLSINPTYENHRSKGVDLFWKYERLDVQMGGRGSINWTKSQREELLREPQSTSDVPKVSGYQGHHKRNVAHYPKNQADAGNIVPLTPKEHFNAHKGNWRNKTEGAITDKHKQTQRRWRKRRAENEFKGASIAAIIGFVTGASIGVIVTLAQNGISPDSLKDAAISGGKAGLEGASFGLINHIGARFIGDIATNAMTGLLAKCGIKITENITKACNMTVVGSIAIIVFSVYQFVTLKRNGISTKKALITVGKQCVISVATLSVTVIIQAAFGGPAALAVSIGIGAIMLSYSLYNMYHNKALMKEIHCYTIEKSYPLIIA